MEKNSYRFIGLLVILGFLIFVLMNNVPTQTKRRKAEQDIYSLLLERQRRANVSSKGKIQIVEFTTAGKIMVSIKIFRDMPFEGCDPETCINTFTGLENGTWGNFLEKNQRSYQIQDFITKAPDIVFVNPTNSNNYFSNSHYWISFSRIGFNFLLTQAIVMVGDCRSHSCFLGSTENSIYSFGDFYILEKHHGNWEITSEDLAWHIESEPH